MTYLLKFEDFHSVDDIMDTLTALHTAFVKIKRQHWQITKLALFYFSYSAIK